MRWPLQRAGGDCPTCGATLVRGAVWCGACGGRADPAAAVEEERVVDAGAEEPADPGRQLVGRRTAVVLLVGLLAVALATVALRTPAPVAVLGHAGVGTGMTSSDLPPDGLRLAWSHDLPEEGWWDDAGTFLAGDGLARIGGRVIDVTTGEVLRTTAYIHGPQDREAPLLSGTRLVVVDQLTGTVLSRTELPDELLQRPVWPSSRRGDVTLLAGDTGSWVVRDDGAVLAALPGWHETWDGPQGREPAAVPLRENMDPQRGVMGDLVLVSMHDGAVLLRREVDPQDAMVARVVGDRAVVALQDGTSRDVAEGPPPWTVELVDATTGEVLATQVFATSEPPRLLGPTAEGGALLAVRSPSGVDVLEVVPGAGDAVHRTTVDASPADPWTDPGRSDFAGRAGFTDEGLLVELVDDEVVGRTLDEEVVWRASSEGAESVLVDGDVVALLQRPRSSDATGPRTTVRFLDGGSGARLGAVRLWPSLEATRWGPRPVQVVGGAVAVGARAGWRTQTATELMGARWVDLVTGEVLPPQDVLEPWAPEDGRLGPGPMWLYTVLGGPGGGAGTPVVGGMRGNTLRLWEDGTVVEHDLPGARPVGEDGAHVQPVGATADLVAVWREVWHESGGDWATWVVDRTTGEVVEFPGLVGQLLTDDLLIGVRIDDEHFAAPAPLVAVDARTGAHRWTGPGVPFTDDHTLQDAALLVMGDGYRRTAVSVEDGRVLWSFDTLEELRPGGVLGRTTVLLATTNGAVLALDRATGDEVWRRDVGAPVTSLTGAGDGAVVATLGGEVVVLDGGGGPVQVVALDEVALHAAALGETLVVQYQDRLVGLRPDGAGFTADDEVDLP